MNNFIRNPKVTSSLRTFPNIGFFSRVFVRKSQDLVSGSTFTFFFSQEQWFDNFSRLKPNFRQKTKKCFLLKNDFSGRALKLPLRKLVRKKVLKIFFINFDFFIQTRSGMMIGIENHLLGSLYTITMTVWPYPTI